MSVFVHKAENVQRAAFDCVIGEMGKRAATPAGKTVRPDVIAAFPANDGADRGLHAFVEIFAETRRNFSITRFRFEQVLLED